MRFWIILLLWGAMAFGLPKVEAAVLVNNGNGTVTDTLTGLVWQQGEPGAMTWGNALSYCEGLSLGGHSDWRLPNVNELESLTDDSRYNPAINTSFFPNAHSSNYWSSTAYAGYPYYAWGVDFYYGDVYSSNKYNYSYVRCVRGGQSGSLGSFDHLDVTYENGGPIWDKTVGQQFPIKITAIKADGSVNAGVNGTVRLYGNLSNVTPTTLVTMTNGVVPSVTVSLDRAGAYQTISAAINSISGTSNPFNVTGPSANTAAISGKVTDGNGHIIVGATVYLDNGVTQIPSMPTGYSGLYQFSNVAPGTYRIYARNYVTGLDGKNRTVNLTNEKPLSIDLVIGSVCNPNGLTPVLFVPGIMGSSMGGNGIYPYLPKGEPDWYYESWGTSSGGLHDPVIPGAVNPGWRALRDVFKNGNPDYTTGCTIIPVPYDWRMDIDKASQQYLEKVITYAKNRSGMGKVNIVAHSMGGLLTRAYIQSDRYKNDIDRLAIVGTPNHGSANAYFLWEGGDPAYLDRIVDAFPGIVDFYSTTINWLHKSMTNDFLFWPMTNSLIGYNQKKIRDFVQQEAPSARQLLPVYDFLDDGKHIFSLSSDNGKNNWLIELNNNFTLKGVETMLFAGYDNKTIETVKVGKPNDLYVDGKAVGGTYPRHGDGTVLRESVILTPFDPQTKSSSHAELINTFKDDIYTFMNPKGAAASVKSTAKMALAAAATTTNTFSLSVQGTTTPYLVDPSGNKSGINPNTRLSENGISGALVNIDLDMGSIELENAVDGGYTLYLSCAVPEDYWLTLSYADADGVKQQNYHGFCNAGTTSFTYTLSSASPDKLTVNKTPQPPTGLQTDAVGSGALTTKLTWTPNSEPAVTGYNVYSRASTAPYLTRIGTTTATSYDTTDPWAVDATMTTRLYAVSAVRADGSESFLSEMVKNDDRDHDGLTDVEELALGTDPTKADTDGDGFSDFLEVMRGSNPLDKNSVPTAWLSVTPSGTGGGGITSDPSGIACTYPLSGGVCGWEFPMNSVVKLFSTPDKDSLFGVWGNACNGSGPCAPVMSGPQEVTATFDFVKPAKVGSTLYDTLTDAYGDSAAGTIFAREYQFAEDLTLGTDKAVIIKGGYDAAYTTRPGFTTINGKLTIGKGSLTVDGIVVR